jgi:hypothetical protein
VCQEGHALESWPAKAVQLVERGDMASERDAGLDRVIAFSDGVVAIAITLLILPLTEIEPGEGATLGNVAADNAGALLGFALSFAVIANYWTIHKDIFRPLRRHSPRLPLPYVADRRWPRRGVRHPVHQHFARHHCAQPHHHQLPRPSPRTFRWSGNS